MQYLHSLPVMEILVALLVLAGILMMMGLCRASGGIIRIVVFIALLGPIFFAFIGNLPNWLNGDCSIIAKNNYLQM
jgi:hypothetical protein